MGARGGEAEDGEGDCFDFGLALAWAWACSGLMSVMWEDGRDGS